MKMRVRRAIKAISVSSLILSLTLAIPPEFSLVRLIQPCVAIPAPVELPITQTRTAETDIEEEPCTVESGEFGIFEKVKAGESNKEEVQKFKFVTANVIPLVEGQLYGWRIHVQPDGARLHWKEEFTLPATPKFWGMSQDDSGQSHGAANSADSADSGEAGDSADSATRSRSGQKVQELQKNGTVCITEKDTTAINGTISNFWSVAKGDPVGQYQMRVWVDGKLAKTFTFQVKGGSPRDKSSKAKAKKNK